jgi:hypothetical protein
MRRETGRSSN